MIIRPAAPEDRIFINDILRAAFETDGEQKLTDALRLSNDITYELVAEENGAIVGVNILSVLTQPKNCLGLGPVAVAPEHQRAGIGKALMAHAITHAQKNGWDAIFLLGDPNYYRQFGFSVDAARPFKCAYPKDYMQALALKEGALASLDKQIIYADAFSKI